MLRAVTTALKVGIIVVILVVAAVAGLLYFNNQKGTIAPAQKLSLAAVFPGSTTDGDFNTLGYVAVNYVSKNLSRTAYSEDVAVPNAATVIQQYIASGYNVIWAHGGQLWSAASSLAPEYPNVTFIGELAAACPAAQNLSKNLWCINAYYAAGFYAMAAGAASFTNSGKIAVIAGLPLPYAYSEIHAAQQAVSDVNASVKLIFAYTGDFNDPVKGEATADSLIAQGADVLISSLNLGTYGVFEAVEASSSPVYIMTQFTDKYANAPTRYITSELFDFSTAISNILTSIQAGNTSGVYRMDVGTGVSLAKIYNVPTPIANAMTQDIQNIISGTLKVPVNTTAP